jgi:hypothetical protein
MYITDKTLQFEGKGGSVDLYSEFSDSYIRPTQGLVPAHPKENNPEGASALKKKFLI